MPEINNWPFVPARWFTKVPRETPRKVRLCVLHDMEYPEKLTAAEDIAAYFHRGDEKNADGSPKKTSAHICCDNNSFVQCVYDTDVAYAAPGANHDGLQIEIAGYGKQSRDNWLDPYSVGALSWASFVASFYCIKYDIPVRRLTVKQLKTPGTKGLCGHVDVSEAFHKSDHTDPGVNFPWDIYLTMVETFVKDRKSA